MRAALAAALLLPLPAPVCSIDNGLGVTPPMGWRSWNQFQCAINQVGQLQLCAAAAMLSPAAGPPL
eukprot:gene9163-8254_t